MQYDNKYDFDHNDCPEYENDVPAEFASDFIVETNTYDYDEIADYDEYDNPENEQAATTDDNNKYNLDKQSSSYSDLSNLYVTETSYDNDVQDNYDVESADDTDSQAYRYAVNPEDEQAATNDYDNFGCECCKTQAQVRCELDDYEIISDVLGSEKQIVKLYSTALCEAAEENFRDIIRENFNEAAADQYKAFSYMQKRGLYQTEQATEQKISEAKQQFYPLCDDCNC